MTRYYNLTISRAFKSPDGYKKRSIVVNDQFPGPAIEANWGDMISVTVVNDISDPKEGATVHWHGLSQQLTPWYDGVPGISQCPIPPQENFTYTFQASSYGTSWWHSHVSGRYIDGIWGAIVIYGSVVVFEPNQWNNELTINVAPVPYLTISILVQYYW